MTLTTQLDAAYEAASPKLRERIDGFADAVRDDIRAIETAPIKSTKHSYGQYLSLLTGVAPEKRFLLVVGLHRAGANPEGLRFAASIAGV